MADITFAQLKDATAGRAVALRSRMTLVPAGGPEDKVFPPSYADTGPDGHKYAVEARQIEDRQVDTILLDSVASQANRAELALLEGWHSKELQFPLAYVDFGGEEEVSDIGKLTVLEAPHRIMDAIFRDSLLGGTLFRLSDVGMAITDANPRDASDLFRYSPTALLFGVWDSTGPKGGLGSKFQRSYVSEIVGLDAKIGVKVGSRLDPLQIERLSAKDVIYDHKDEQQVWTFNPEEAKDTKDKKTQSSQPSKINHGNIPPQIDKETGGVTISKAVQTTVISLAGIRKLRFGERNTARDSAVHTAIAALGLAAIAYQYEMDYDLRSRCLLLPIEPPKLELLARDGSAPEEFSISTQGAADILKQAADGAAAAGLSWETSETKLRLTPAAKLVELIGRSRNMSKLDKPTLEDN